MDFEKLHLTRDMTVLSRKSETYRGSVGSLSGGRRRHLGFINRRALTVPLLPEGPL